MADNLADTHTPLWHFTRPAKLGAGAVAALAEVDSGAATLFVPVIVLAELLFAIEGGRVQADFEALVKSLRANPNVSIVDWTLERTLSLRSLTTVPEMHDRMIVAEALARGASSVHLAQET